MLLSQGYLFSIKCCYQNPGFPVIIKIQNIDLVIQ